MIEYGDVEERRAALPTLIGIEDRVWVQAGNGERVYAIADEDLERENDVKTSAVHFLRFQLDAATIAAMKDGAPLAFGIDHENYTHELNPVGAETAAALAADLS